jgi:hypothetical protein
MLWTIARSARVTAAQAHAAGKAMRVRLFFVPLLLFALACSGFAQVDHALIKNKPDAPLQITEAHCGQNAQGSYCSAALEFGDTKETWDGYGLLWTLTFENGSKATGRQATDRSIERTGDPSGSYKPSGRFYKPREIVDIGNGVIGGTGFGMKDRDGKILRLTDAQVEVEFVVNTNGTVWGDSKSPSYLRMMANRKAAKEGSQKAEPPLHPLRWQKPREPSVSPELARALRLPCRARDLSPSNIARCDRGSEPHEQGYTLAQVARLVRVPQRDRNGRSQRRFSGRGALPGGLVVFP